jgi:hypothetical protein
VDELVEENIIEINNKNSKSAFKPPENLNKHKTKSFFSLVDHI